MKELEQSETDLKNAIQGTDLTTFHSPPELQVRETEIKQHVDFIDHEKQTLITSNKNLLDQEKSLRDYILELEEKLSVTTTKVKMLEATEEDIKIKNGQLDQELKIAQQQLEDITQIKAGIVVMQ